MIKPSQPGFRPWENRPTSLRSRKCIPPLVAGATTLPPRWEACHWIRGSRGSPMNPVPLTPPQFGGAAKGKRLNGQARCPVRLPRNILLTIDRGGKGVHR